MDTLDYTRKFWRRNPVTYLVNYYEQIRTVVRDKHGNKIPVEPYHILHLSEYHSEAPLIPAEGSYIKINLPYEQKVWGKVVRVEYSYPDTKADRVRDYTHGVMVYFEKVD